MDGAGPEGLGPTATLLQEKVVMGVISAPWSPGEVTSSLLTSAGSIPSAAGQLDRAESITSGIPPAPLWGDMDVPPPSPDALGSPATGAGVSIARRGVPCVTWCCPPGSCPHLGAARRGAGATEAAFIRGLICLWGCAGPAGTRSAPLYTPSVFRSRGCAGVRCGSWCGMRGLATDAGPVRSAGTGGGVRGRGGCRVGAVAGPSRPVPPAPAGPAALP